MDRLQKVKLLIMDVDGVLTDGSMIYIEEPETSSTTAHNSSPVTRQMKIFNAQDGLGIRMAMLVGLKIAWVTGNVSPTVARRARDVGVTDLYQGARHKPEAVRELASRYDLRPEEIAYIGDDLNDLPAFAAVGATFAVNNAASDVKDAADFTTEKSGGSGAVREAIETILRTQGIWQNAVAAIFKELEREQAEGDKSKVVG
jgi:3-deoxy-D-manno-octulosonate 8-phosphate phosphatase (KDO 8-P phosphatase)